MLIPLTELRKKYRTFNPKGVLHVGASTGQEAEAYFGTGIDHTMWIEPIDEVYYRLVPHVNKFPFKTKLCFNVLISDVDNQLVDFHIANNEGQSSSMLEFGTHTKEHPTVKFEKTIKKLTIRLDTLLGANTNINFDNFDFLNIDVQGVELKVIQSLGSYLNNFKWIYVEVNEKELYKGCTMISELDYFLGHNNFSRKETKMTNWGWGDAFYIKRND